MALPAASVLVAAPGVKRSGAGRPSSDVLPDHVFAAAAAIDGCEFVGSSLPART